MLDALATAIETLSIGVDGAELTAAIAQRDRLEAKITLAAAEFDAAELWGLDGSVSMAAWLRTHTGQTPRQARRMERTGRRLRQLPGVAAARTNGALSSGHVDAIVATLSDRTSALFADQETTILVTLAHHDVRDAASYLQQWQALALAYLDSLDSLDDTPPEPEPPARRVHPTSPPEPASLPPAFTSPPAQGWRRQPRRQVHQRSGARCGRSAPALRTALR